MNKDVNRSRIAEEPNKPGDVLGIDGPLTHFAVPGAVFKKIIQILEKQPHRKVNGLLNLLADCKGLSIKE